MGILNPNQRSNQPQSAGRRKSDLHSSLGGMLQALNPTVSDEEYNEHAMSHNHSIGNARLNVARDILHRRVFMNNDAYYEHRPDFLPMMQGFRTPGSQAPGADESRAGGSGAPFEGSSGLSASGPGAQTLFTRPRAPGINPGQFHGPAAKGIDSGTPAIGASPQSIGSGAPAIETTATEGPARSPMFAGPTSPLGLGQGGL